MHNMVTDSLHCFSRYIDTHQRELRVEQYDQILQWVPEENQETGNVGRHVILPSSFVESPRDMNARFQDAMTIVRIHGKPDYFITITCNPKEVRCHTIVVFKIKLYHISTHYIPVIA